MTRFDEIEQRHKDWIYTTKYCTRNGLIRAFDQAHKDRGELIKMLEDIGKLPDEWMNLKGEDFEEKTFNSGLHNAGYELKRIIRLGSK